MLGPIAEEMAQYADARALEPVEFEKGRIARGDVGGALARDRIGRVMPGNCVEQYSGIRNGPCDRPDGVLRQAAGNEPRSADQAHGGTKADEIVSRGRRPDRVDPVGSDSEQTEVGCDAGAGAPAGPARRSRQVVGVQGLAKLRTDGLPPGGKLVQVGLCQDDGACPAQPLDNKRILRGHIAPKARRACCGFDATALDIVLDQHRDAVQRRQGLRRLPGGLGVHAFCLCQRLRVEPEDAVDAGAALIVGRDPVQVAAYQLPCRQPAVTHRGMRGGNGGLHQVERRLIAGSARI